MTSTPSLPRLAPAPRDQFAGHVAHPSGRAPPNDNASSSGVIGWNAVRHGVANAARIVPVMRLMVAVRD